MPFLLLILFPFLPSPAKSNPLYLICGTTGNFTTNSTYNTNLNTLLTTLSSNLSATGFASTATGSIPNRVYGLTFCRGDTDITDCRYCVSTASSDIQQLCPTTKEAAIWYESCQLRYSNTDFLFSPDFNVQYYMYNTQSVSADELSQFETLTPEFMGNVSDLAVRNSSWLYATGQTTLAEGDVVYGLVQCALNLSVSNCRRCLNDTVGLINQAPLKGKEGGRTFGYWCSITYEIYKFYNGASMLQFTPSPPKNGSSTANSTRPQTDTSDGGIIAAQVRLL